MNLLYILSGYPNYSEVFIQNEVERLKTSGHDVHVLDIRSSRSRSVNGIQVHANTTSLFKIILAWFRSPKSSSKGFMNPLSFIHRKRIGIKSLLLFITIPYLRNKIKNISPDHIISHFLFTTSHAAAHLAHSLSIPYHIRLHTSYSTLPKFCRNNVLMHARSISAISHRLVTYYSQMLQGQKEIQLIRQDVNIDRLLAYNSETYPVDNHFLAIGRLVPKKGFIPLLYGIAEYKKRFNDSFSLYIYGTGPLQSELEELIAEKGLVNNVFLMGRMKHSDLMLKLHNASILFVPSIDTGQDVDGIPSVMVESMLLNTTVIGTQIGGMSEILKDGQTGYVFSDVAPNTIAETIQRAIDDRLHWPKIKENALVLVKEEYSRKLDFK